MTENRITINSETASMNSHRTLFLCFLWVATYLNAVRRDQRPRDWGYWSLEPDRYWYGGWPYGQG